MAKTHHGEFLPKNTHKLLSNKRITYRSSWELQFMRFLDSNPNIIHWASEHEKVRIPYLNPLKNRYTVYVPDFIIVYKDRHGTKKIEMIEIKPAAETFLQEAKSQKHKAALAVNMAKWKAAHEWASRNGMRFRVLTEYQLFNNPKKPRK